MARGEVQKPLPRPWRTSYNAPSAPSIIGIISPNNISPRTNPQPYSPQPGAASKPPHGKRRLRLSLIPTLTQHDRSRPKVAAVPLLDAAATVRQQAYKQSNMAGASMNTTYSVAAPGMTQVPRSTMFPAAPQHFSSTPFSPTSPHDAVDEMVRYKGNKWKMLGNLFTRKPSMIFHSPTEVSPTAPAGRTGSVRPERYHYSHRPQQPRQSSVGIERNDRDLNREHSKPFPHRVQKARPLSRTPSSRRPSLPAKDKPVPPIPKEDNDDKGPPVPPKVLVDIPDTTLDRYSVMFNNVLNPRESTLLVRRQAQVERLNLQNANNVRASVAKKRQSSLPINSIVPTAAGDDPTVRSANTTLLAPIPIRRATLPSPTKSPSYSLFPSPSIRGSPAAPAWSPKTPQRPWAVSALSPGMQPSPLSSAPARNLSEQNVTSPAKTNSQLRATGLPSNHPVPKAAEQRPQSKAIERPAKKHVPWPIEIPTRKSVDPIVRKAVERAPENPAPKPVEKDKSPPAVDKPMPELPIENTMEGAVPPTIVEEDEEEPEVSPLTECPSTPDHERWEPKVSPRPNRSFSLGEQETDPRDSAVDGIIQISEETQHTDVMSDEVRKGSLDAGPRQYATFAQANSAQGSPMSAHPDRVSSLATRASTLKGQAAAIHEWKLSLNKPLPTPSPDQVISPGVAPRKQSAPIVPQRRNDDDIDWHVVSPRKASLPVPGFPSPQLPYSRRQSSLGGSSPRQPSLTVRPLPRASRAMPPRVTYGRQSAALAAAANHLPAPSPISQTGHASPASATSSPITPSPQGPVPNPLASAPTTAAEISIARQISLSRRQQRTQSPVAKNVRPPQQAQLVVPPSGRQPALDSASVPWNHERYTARQSHHVMLETA